MHRSFNRTLFGAQLSAATVLFATALAAAPLPAQIPQAIAVPGEIPATFLHAEGAQIYQCEVDDHHRLVWQLREPIATLLVDDYTVGRHYGGLHWEHADPRTPLWEHTDGSSVKASIVASAAGATPSDLPWLKFRVVTQNGNGRFYGVTSVQRLNTHGGVAQGNCDKADEYLSVPYSADYLFWRVD